MEVLVGFLAVVLIAILIGRVSALQNELRAMREQLQEFMRSMARSTNATGAPAAPKVPPAAAPPTAPPKPVVPPEPAPPVMPAPPDVPEPTAAPSRPVVPPAPSAPTPSAGPALPTPPAPARDVREEIQRTTATSAAPRVVPITPPPPPPSHKPSFLERNPDLEKFIGENLMNKIGIAILVVGLGLLLKYAIGQGYVSETARTLIGIGSGGLLIYFAHRLRDKFRAFSSVLVGGGLAVLYFSIAIAYQDYKIIPQTAAFLVMVGITAIGVLLTLVYDRKELAVIALLGGFASPFMASSGDGNYQVLFSYLLILNVGMLVLANYKKWHLINIISFVLTAFIFAGWLGVKFLEMQPRPVWPALGFATGFFLVFFGMNLRYNLKHNAEFGALDFALLLANTACYFAAGMVVLNTLPTRLNGLFVVALALFHLVFAIYLYKRANTSRYLVLLLIGLVLTFISLAAPVQLKGNHITLFWSAECVLLLWFSQRTGIKLVERASLLVLALMLLSLIMDMGKYYGDNEHALRVLLNKPWITGMVSAIALWAYARLLKNAPERTVMIPGIEPISVAGIRTVVLVLMGLVLYGVNFLELGHQLRYRMDHHLVAMGLTTYTLLAFSLVFAITRKANTNARWGVAALQALALFAQITLQYHHATTALLGHRSDPALAPQVSLLFVLDTAAALIAIVCGIQLMRTLLDRRTRLWNTYLWVVCIFLVVFSSQVLDMVMLHVLKPAMNEDIPAEARVGYLQYAYMDALRSARKAAYPILWGVGSFIFMWYGMRTRQRTVRIVALSLFGLTLLKLFAIDVWDLTEGARVAAFICLGILILVVSFMYNKLKGLLSDDGPQEPVSQNRSGNIPPHA